MSKKIIVMVHKGIVEEVLHNIDDLIVEVVDFDTDGMEPSEQEAIKMKGPMDANPILAYRYSGKIGVQDNIKVESVYREINKEYKLEPGNRIKAIKDTEGRTSSYDYPGKIEIPAGTVLEVPTYGTRKGDVFCKVIEGKPVYHHKNGVSEHSPLNDLPVGLLEGHGTSAPEDLGVIDTNIWEVVTNE